MRQLHGTLVQLGMVHGTLTIQRLYLHTHYIQTPVVLQVQLLGTTLQECLVVLCVSITARLKPGVAFVVPVNNKNYE
jgi:hypothetical protein